MAFYGYARVSSADQDYTLQEQALRQAGCDVIRAEKASGTSMNGQTELDLLLQFLRPGDTLVVTRVDRLARSIKDLQDIVVDLKKRKVSLRATEQPIDTETAAGKAFFDMLGVFAEFETNLRKNARKKGLRRPRSRVCIEAERSRLIPARLKNYRITVWGQQRLPGNSALAVHRSIG